MRPSAASAYEVYATGDGFFDPEQSALTEPLSCRPTSTRSQATAEFRSGWVLGEVASGLPGTAVSPRHPAAGRGAARTDLAAPVRRAVVDGTDRLRRALRSLDSIRPLSPPKLEAFDQLRERAQIRAQASVRTCGRICSISSNSAWPQISGGATWTTGSPRSSARQ